MIPRVRAFGAAASLLLATSVVLDAASLGPESVRGWDAYVRATEARIGRELSGGHRFLSHEFTSASSVDPAQLVAGLVAIVKVSTAGPGGAEITVPGAMVHHWRGTIYIPGASIDEILARLGSPRPDDLAQEDVIQARVLERRPGSLRLFLRLQRTQIVTVVYNTEHAVRYTRHDAQRASSRSVATRIAEVADAATPDEREREPGEDRGFLWRLNSYWRYQQVRGGVLVECESISLSRTVPHMLRAAVRPLLDQVARGSMERTLLGMRARFTRETSRGE